jgi:hypothetical protein
MVLFGDMGPFGTAIIVIAVLGFLAFKAHLYFCRPEQWIAQQQAKADKEAKIEAAKLANKGKGLGNVVGGILGAVLKNRPH